MMQSKRKMLTCMLATGMAFGVTAGMAPTAFAADTSAEVRTQALEAEIVELTERLNSMESELHYLQKTSDKQAKDIKKVKKAEKNQLKWNGSIKTGYWSDSTGTEKIKGEAKINASKQLKDGFGVKVGVKYKATSYEPNDVTKYGKTSASYKEAYEKNKIQLTYAEITKKFGAKDAGLIEAGIQGANLGEGIYLSKSSVKGFSTSYKFTDKDYVKVFYGRDSQEYLCDGGTRVVKKWNKKTKEWEYSATTDHDRARVLWFADYRHNFSKDAYAGMYVSHQQPEEYIGIYGKTPVVGKFWVSGEYIHNSNKNKPLASDYADGNASYGYEYTGANASTDGYMVGLHYGHAKKKGTWETAVKYFNVDQNLFMNDKYSGYKDYIDEMGFKGFGWETDYAISDNSKISLLRYWGSTKPDGRNVNKDGALKKATKNSFYLKFVTKF